MAALHSSTINRQASWYSGEPRLPCRGWTTPATPSMSTEMKTFRAGKRLVGVAGDQAVLAALLGLVEPAVFEVANADRGAVGQAVATVGGPVDVAVEVVGAERSGFVAVVLLEVRAASDHSVGRYLR